MLWYNEISRPKLSKNAIVHQLVDVSAGALGTSNTIWSKLQHPFTLNPIKLLTFASLYAPKRML